MLDELLKLLIAVIAAAPWKVHIVEYRLARSYGLDDAQNTLVSTADTDNEWRYDNISAGDSQDLVLNSPKQPKIGPKSAGNSQDCPRLLYRLEGPVMDMI